jgi:hypothetical protein
MALRLGVFAALAGFRGGVLRMELRRRRAAIVARGSRVGGARMDGAGGPSRGGGVRAMSLDPALARFTRRVPRFRGWHRLLEPLRLHYVRKYAGRADRWIVIDDFEGDLRMKLDRSALMASVIYWRGIHSYSEATLVRRLLPEDGVFLDIGANQGELTLIAARKAPRGRVYAFEPVPIWFELLSENVRLNSFTNVELVNLALSDREGEQVMYSASGAPGDEGFHEGLSTFRQAEARSSRRISMCDWTVSPSGSSWGESIW